MSTNIHLTRIQDTLANVVASMDDGQLALLSNTGNRICSRSGSNFVLSAISRVTTDGVAFTYQDESFDDLTLYGKLSAGGELSPDCDSGGATFNHGTSDGFAFTLKNGDVAHSFTGSQETDTYFSISKVGPNNGGARLKGYSDVGTIAGFAINGFLSTSGTPSKAAIEIAGAKSNGDTGAASLAIGEKIISIQNLTTEKACFYGDGGLYITGDSPLVNPLLSLVRGSYSILSDVSDSGICSITANNNQFNITSKQAIQMNSSDTLTAGGTLLSYQNNATEVLALYGNGDLFVDGKISTGGEGTPDCAAGGITILAGESSKQATLKISGGDFAHPFTDLAETDTALQISSGTSAGGMTISSYSHTALPLVIAGYWEPSTSSVPCVKIVGAMSDGGTGAATITSGYQIMSIFNYTTEIGYFTSEGALYLDGKLSLGGESAPDCDAGGATINHGANDGFALTIKNSDVAHPFTDVCETDTYFNAAKASATLGGAALAGYSDGDGCGLYVAGRIGNATPSSPAIQMVAQKTNGSTSVAALGATERILALYNHGTEEVYSLGNGSLYIETNKRVACGGGATGSTTTADGTVTLEINGVSYYLLKAAAA